VDTADDLVSGNQRTDLAGNVLVAVELGHVARAQAHRFDGEHRAARRRLGHGELVYVVGAVTAEDHRPTRLHDATVPRTGPRTSGLRSVLDRDHLGIVEEGPE
jgi:hypothetical protein